MKQPNVMNTWGRLRARFRKCKRQETSSLQRCWLQVWYLYVTNSLCCMLNCLFSLCGSVCSSSVCVCVCVCAYVCVCVCLVYRKQMPDRERQSRHPVWTDRSRANVAPRMHSINTHGHISHTHTHTHTLNRTAESHVPQEPVKIEKPPIFAGMTSKKA